MPASSWLRGTDRARPLGEVPADATVQTVIRRFGSKDGLVRALAQVVTPQVEAQRGAAPVGDIRAAVASLADHYEAEGDLAMRLLRQERRVPAFAEVTAVGRRVHLERTTRVFAPRLDARAGVAGERLSAGRRRLRRLHLVPAAPAASSGR